MKNNLASDIKTAFLLSNGYIEFGFMNDRAKSKCIFFFNSFALSYITLISIRAKCVNQVWVGKALECIIGLPWQVQ